MQPIILTNTEILNPNSIIYRSFTGLWIISNGSAEFIPFDRERYNACRSDYNLYIYFYKKIEFPLFIDNFYYIQKYIRSIAIFRKIPVLFEWDLKQILPKIFFISNLFLKDHHQFLIYLFLKAIIINHKPVYIPFDTKDSSLFYINPENFLKNILKEIPSH